MKTILFIGLLCGVSYNQALDCGMARMNNDEFKKVMTDCIKDNQTFSEIMEMILATSQEDDSSEEDDEQVPITRGASTMKPTTMSMKVSTRTKRSNKMITNPSAAVSTSMNNKFEVSSPTPEESSKVEDQGEANVVGDDLCVLHCMFKKLDLIDSNGLPDRKKFIAALIKSRPNKQTVDVLQESAEECFQQIEKETLETACEHSTKLIGCLAEKGVQNCEDWPAGDLIL